MAGDPLGAILHLEGAEPIEPDLSNLEGWYERGLRSIGLVWSRPNAFACGAPFRYPGSADEGPGLTRAGRALVDACGRLGIVVDVSHLNTRGLRGVLRRADRRPVVATHSNAYAVCPCSRNLTDAELRAIAATRGVVGITFSVAMLDEALRKIAHGNWLRVLREVCRG